MTSAKDRCAPGSCALSGIVVSTCSGGVTATIEQLADTSQTPDEAFEVAETAREIQFALQSIAKDKREIVVLRDYLDLSYAEIADVLEIAPGTVMSRLHRARMALKEALEQHDRK
jgi:RNA polymerase sigma-70 factor (ECF subfamily)